MYISTPVAYDWNAMTLRFVFRDDDAEDDDLYEREFLVPALAVVCGRCDGRGTHDHEAFSNGITSSEWDGPDWDEESREAYMRGAYDVRCTECEGKRVQLVPDEARAPTGFMEIYGKALDDDYRGRLEREHERRMGY